MTTSSSSSRLMASSAKRLRDASSYSSADRIFDYGQPQAKIPSKQELRNEDKLKGSQRGVLITDDLVQSFSVTKLFQLNKGKVNHIDYDRLGNRMITSSTDDQLVLYDCQSGTLVRSCYSKKYGVDLVTFTHSAETVVYASRKVNHELRYLSLHDNKFIRYFSGHTNKVVCLKKSPSEDKFMSASTDKTVRLWDVRSPNCQGLIRLLRPGVISFDPEGLIFAIGLENHIIKLYDGRSFDKGPFNTFYLPRDPLNLDWNDLQFSPCGTQIVVNTAGPCVRVVDAFSGNLIWQLNNRDVKSIDERYDVSYTPDSRYLFVASSNGKIHIWRTSDGAHLAVLDSRQPSAVRCLKFNPKMLVMASADTETALWLPRANDKYFEELESFPKQPLYTPEPSRGPFVIN